MESCRVILSDHNNAYYNMAMDEAMLENFINNDPTPVLRIYGWEPEAFSFGVGQDAEDNFNIEECRKRGMAFVRRMTGGGVLFHSGDISYSIVASLKDLGCEGSVVASYKTICAFLIEMYKGLGLQAGFAGEAGTVGAYCNTPLPKRRDIDLCMASNEKYDILVGKRKLGGNAQKRRGSAILQHGSIPLSATISRSREFVKDPSMVDSLCATSLGEVIGREISYKEAEERLVKSFEKVFHCHCEEAVVCVSADEAILPIDAPIGKIASSVASLPPRNDSVKNYNSSECELFNNLLQNKYSTDLWNLERRDDRKKAVLA